MSRVTSRTQRLAYQSIRKIADAMVGGEQFLTYRQLDELLEVPNPNGQGLGPVLDRAATMCMERGLPDISTVIVTQKSVDAGLPFPSDEVFSSSGRTKVSGLSPDQVAVEMDRVRSYNWRAVRELNLSG